MKLPVVLFVFRRSHTLEGICERILKYNPPKVYVYGDGPRDESEKLDVAKTRRLVTTLLADATETVFDFSSSNRGVKENIGGGALKTFEKELEASVNNTLSCGLLGPEILLTTVDTSKETVSVKITSPLAHSPCSLEYFSTKEIVALSLPDN